MDERVTGLTDEQRWVYPHWHPWYNNIPHRRFMPFPGRPMGDESYRHATILSMLGRGPKGPQGDPFTYDDLTQAQIRELAAYFGRVGIERIMREVAINSSNNTGFGLTEEAGITLGAGDILYVFINGLLTQAYEVENNVITFDDPITIDPNLLPSEVNHVELEVLHFEVDETEPAPTEESSDSEGQQK
jgi:hypothetical protein